MIAYLIKGLTRKGLEVFTFSNIDAAGRAAETRFTDYPTTVVGEESDLASMPGASLVLLYNNLIAEGAPVVNKFTTRGDGARRIFALLVEKYAHQPVESEPESVAPADAPTNQEDDMATKGKKTKKAKTAKPPKAPREKKVRTPRAKKDRKYKEAVVSKGSESTKNTALEMIQRANGATAEEIKDRLGCSIGTAKNLVWYLRRDKHKIVVDRTKERKPYVIA